jgi:hypothetical protein
MKLLASPLFILFSFTLPAAEPEKLLDSLRTEMRAELRAKKEPSKEGEIPRYSNAEAMLLQLASSDALKEERQAQTIQVLEQIRAISFTPKIDELSGGLITELREGNAKRVKALRENFERTVRSALIIGLNATTPKDLDAPLGELAKLQKQIMLLGYREDGRQSFNAEGLQAVEQILTTIQDALLASLKNTAKRSRDPGERIQSTASSYGRQLGEIMPRSEFLEKIQAVAERISPNLSQKPLSQREFNKIVQELIQGARKLDDLDSVLTKIDELSAQQREVNGYYGDSSLTSQLRSYRKTYDEMRAGAATSLSFATTSYSSEGSESLNDIKVLLVKFALTRVLGTPPDLAPKADESVPTFMQRALETARSTSNWLLLTRVLDTAQTMSLSAVVSSNDTTALRQFLGGINLEKSRQYSGAVSSFTAALKTGSQIIPVTLIGDTLDAIKKEHPEDYEAGTKMTSSGSAYYDERTARMMSGYPSRSFPGYPSSAPPQNQTLAIPAVPSEKPAPAKEPKPDPQPPAESEKKAP